jgi:hypothetical protein
MAFRIFLKLIVDCFDLPPGSFRKQFVAKMRKLFTRKNPHFFSTQDGWLNKEIGEVGSAPACHGSSLVRILTFLINHSMSDNAKD